MITVNCENCGCSVDISPSRLEKSNGNGICCSRQCSSEFKILSKIPNVECAVCKSMFHRKQSHIDGVKHKDKMTCSIECCAQMRSDFFMSGKNNHQFGLKGELNASSKEGAIVTGLGYLVVDNHTHPFSNKSGKMLFHRLVMEEHLINTCDFEFVQLIEGRHVLGQEFVVHHKDENKLNNTINNLQVMTRSAHSSLHNIESPAERDDITGKFITSGKILSGKLNRSNRTDAGQDVYSNENILLKANSSVVVSTGLVIAIPEGSVGLLLSRSGLSIKHKLEVGAGCIDSGYRGEVKVHLYNHSDDDYQISNGERVAQLVTIKIDLVDYEKSEELTETERGSSGFGDSGVK